MSDKTIVINYVVKNKSNPKDTFCYVHTKGLEEHDQLNLCMPRYLDGDVAYGIIDTICKWIADNPDFDFRETHVCNDEDGKTMWAVKFGLIKCCGETCWLVNVLDENGKVDNSWMDNMNEDLRLLTKIERNAAYHLMGWE